ncbi:hypothetical protein KYI13_03830 [Macrococcoides bohemicum]|uniref:hypothetical protein n=1 Tax=Macrococcoides bohemicum TaxID=1903056 RepID=UPI001C5DE139|nr:hypothetical protein [Macrococcus bohemicus]QYA45460.1 hypothetical protein KYI13_03830 [Macrococcus bohemicus]
MRIKIMRRKSIPVDQPIIRGDLISNHREETTVEYEKRLDDFVQTVDVIDIKTEVNGAYTDGDGEVWTNLIIMYRDKEN